MTEYDEELQKILTYIAPEAVSTVEDLVRKIYHMGWDSGYHTGSMEEADYHNRMEDF